MGGNDETSIRIKVGVILAICAAIIGGIVATGITTMVSHEGRITKVEVQQSNMCADIDEIKKDLKYLVRETTSNRR